MRILPRRRSKLERLDDDTTAIDLAPVVDAAPELEIEPAVVAREMAESLTNTLHDSDTASEVLHDSHEDSTRPGARRLLLGVAALLLTASGLAAARRHRRR